MKEKKAADKRETWSKREIPVNIDKRKTLTLDEIEQVYGFPVETIKKWINRDLRADGKPPLEAFKPGQKIMVFKEVFEAYIKRFPTSA